jgi:hypothetical protein
MVALIAEQPDRCTVLLNLDGPNRDFFRISGNWHEARVHTELFGGRVTLTRAWLGERRLCCGVVLDMKLEVDSVTNFGLDLIRRVYESIRSILGLSDNNADVFGRYERSGNEENGSNRELHGWDISSGVVQSGARYS